MSRRTWAMVAAAALVVVAGLAGSVWWLRSEAERDAAADAALGAYVAGWQARDLSGVPFTEGGAADDFAAAFDGLGEVAVTASASPLRRDGGVATAELGVEWSLPGEARWDYATPVRLVEQDGAWLVSGPGDGSPWHPDLAVGETVSLERTAAQRGDLLGRDDEPLMPQGTVYQVALDPVQADRAGARALQDVTGVDGIVEDLDERTRTGSQAPIPVITYRERDYQERAERLEAIDGVIAPTATQPLGPTRTFGQPLLGTVGEVTAEMVEESGGRLSGGDRAGRSGLQRQYDETLAGTAGSSVVTSEDETLFTADAVAGADVVTTLDPVVQRAAEAALDGADLDVPGALVAVDVPSGEVVAVANTPTSGFDRAVTGRYPPGSTFKVATTYAYLTEDITTPSTPVPCPEVATVDGRRFTNYAGESIGGEPVFAEDFAASCNTAFVSLSTELAPDDLTTAAGALGIGAGWADGLGVAGAFDGSVPATEGGTDSAAAAIGQGRVEVSPVALAVMSASVGRGTWVPPRIVVEDGGWPRPTPLDGRAVGQIRSMMADVVATGTATVMRGTPGGTVRGKTGTAEYGDDTADPYVWFTGYQGDLAFAVLVEGGRSGGSVSAPIAKEFLTDLATR
ncbi:hypothetical protein KC207_16645 [Phycicoccus sp. BSK3Z-2]|uniref:Beta-lactamase n=1 Tax=Phycicoccus avicenniae TaxID=2828860 RepID=A0A941DA58_9MICO|nr:penicillin-binding transpeptidase domain-containing protein [Phycicoccus avicenniae]MBR7744924.1 hypothetical protein [Phycicoccus avicenniae]